MPAGSSAPVAPAACGDANVPAIEARADGVQITIPAATVRTGAPLSIFTGETPSHLLVAFRDSGCGAFDSEHGWFRWGA